MSRFVDVGKGYLNTDYIESVVPLDREGKILITMKSGETVTCPDIYLDDVTGRDIIRSLVPVDCCFAEYKARDEETYQVPVKLIAVTESGEARPVELCETYTTFMDAFPNYEGMFWKEEADSPTITTAP